MKASDLKPEVVMVSAANQGGKSLPVGIVPSLQYVAEPGFEGG